VVSRQTLQAGSACKALRDDDTDGGSKSVPVFRLPLVDVLQKRRERAVLERFLEVLVSSWPSFFVSATHTEREKLVLTS
jgi:hypothetical protein